MEILKYRSTTKEVRWGLQSSIKSEGLVGKINRVIYRVTRFAPDLFGDQVDIVAFIKILKTLAGQIFSL